MRASALLIFREPAATHLRSRTFFPRGTSRASSPADPRTSPGGSSLTSAAKALEAFLGGFIYRGRRGRMRDLWRLHMRREIRGDRFYPPLLSDKDSANAASFTTSPSSPERWDESIPD